MAFGKDTQVSMMMGFPAVADKIQETDRLRGYENTYVTISEVKKECLDGVKITLEAIGWKQAADIKKEDWLCGKEEDEFIVVEDVASVKQENMVMIRVLESGSIIANGVTLGIYA